MRVVVSSMYRAGHLYSGAGQVGPLETAGQQHPGSVAPRHGRLLRACVRASERACVRASVTRPLVLIKNIAT